MDLWEILHDGKSYEQVEKEEGEKAGSEAGEIEAGLYGLTGGLTAAGRSESWHIGYQNGIANRPTDRFDSKPEPVKTEDYSSSNNYNNDDGGNYSPPSLSPERPSTVPKPSPTATSRASSNESSSFADTLISGVLILLAFSVLSEMISEEKPKNKNKGKKNTPANPSVKKTESNKNSKKFGENTSFGLARISVKKIGLSRLKNLSENMDAMILLVFIEMAIVVWAFYPYGSDDFLAGQVIIGCFFLSWVVYRSTLAVYRFACR